MLSIAMLIGFHPFRLTTIPTDLSQDGWRGSVSMKRRVCTMKIHFETKPVPLPPSPPEIVMRPTKFKTRPSQAEPPNTGERLTEAPTVT